ncbi:MAG: hypothetical protein WCF24_10870 [Acidimicrobiales bacterium]
MNPSLSPEECCGRRETRASVSFRVKVSAPCALTACAEAFPEAAITSVNLQQITKVYPNGFQALYDLDMEVAHGECVVLVGGWNSLNKALRS